MGRKGQLKGAFLRQHPICCFCGGVTPAAEIDHVPARVIFDDRQWPEGYTFPACVSCNRATRHAEQIVALVSRLYPDSKTAEQQRAFAALLQSANRHYPGLLEEMRPSVREIRNARKKYGLNVPPGKTTRDLPVLRVGGAIVRGAVSAFGRKLGCALYYKHVGEILPATGGIAIKWFSNLQIEQGAIPRDLAPFVSNFPPLERNRADLTEQFFYRFGITDTRRMAAFLAFMRSSFAMLLFVAADASQMELPGEAEVMPPFPAPAEAVDPDNRVDG